MWLVSYGPKQEILSALPAASFCELLWINPGANRRLNWALHMVAMVRLRMDGGRSKRFMERAQLRGKTKRSGLRGCRPSDAIAGGEPFAYSNLRSATEARAQPGVIRKTLQLATCRCRIHRCEVSCSASARVGSRSRPALTQRAPFENVRARGQPGPAVCRRLLQILCRSPRTPVLEKPMARLHPIL